jgi:hypothetical protein
MIHCAVVLLSPLSSLLSHQEDVQHEQYQQSPGWGTLANQAFCFYGDCGLGQQKIVTTKL